MTSAQTRMNALGSAHAFAGVYRAIVSLPDMLSGRERPLEERIVFFEADPPRRPHDVLTELLRAVWRVDTSDWVERGLIYNIYSAAELIRDRAEDGHPPAHALFDVGGGGDGSDTGMLDRVLYARGDHVDLFVRPDRKSVV